MRATWEKLLHHVGTIHKHGIIKYLLNKKRVNISKPKHTQDALDEHQLATKIRDQSYKHLYKYLQFQKGVYEEQVIRVEPDIADKAKMS